MDTPEIDRQALYDLTKDLRDWAVGCEIAASSWCDVFRWLAEGKPITPQQAAERLIQTQQAFADIARTRQKLDQLLSGGTRPDRVM